MRFEMKAFTWIAALSILLQYSFAARFTNSEYSLTLGKPFTLTWQGASGPVTITLRTGDPRRTLPVALIVSGATGTSFTWTPDVDLPSGDYVLEIKDNGTPDYSPQFRVGSPSSNDGTSSVPSQTPSTTRSSGSPSGLSTTTGSTGASASGASSSGSSSSTSTSTSPSNPTTEPSSGSDGLSTGAKAGIGVGAGVGALAIFGAGALFFYRKGKQAGGRATGTGTGSDKLNTAEIGPEPRAIPELGGQAVSELAEGKTYDGDGTGQPSRQSASELPASQDNRDPVELGDGQPRRGV